MGFCVTSLDGGNVQKLFFYFFSRTLQCFMFDNLTGWKKFLLSAKILPKKHMMKIKRKTWREWKRKLVLLSSWLSFMMKAGWLMGRWDGTWKSTIRRDYRWRALLSMLLVFASCSSIRNGLARWRPRFSCQGHSEARWLQSALDRSNSRHHLRRAFADSRCPSNCPMCPI